MERPSRKLNYEIVELYKILKKIGNLYKIKLLNLVKIYSVFLPDKL